MYKSINIIKEKRKNKKLISFSLLFLTFMMTLSCSKNPYTQKNDLTLFMNKNQEQKIGDRQHNLLINNFGGVYKSPLLGVYVASIGAKIANSANLNAESFTFTILNTPIVNAFASPGGYIYVTRGLVAMCNSEEELAFVIAHEIAHVIARHSAQRYSRDMLGKIGATILGATVDSNAAHNLGNLVNDLTLARFSRANELEADRLAIKYLIDSGYNPTASGNFLNTLINLREYRKKIGFPQTDNRSVFATHPPTLDRLKLSENLKEEYGNIKASLSFMKNINAIIFGDDPSQGIIINERFIHPELNFSIRVPENFAIENSKKSLIAIKENIALIKIDISNKDEYHSDPLTYLTNIWKTSSKLKFIEVIDINKFKAATGLFFTEGRINQYSGKIQIRYLALRLDETKYLRFIFISRANTDISEPSIQIITIIAILFCPFLQL